MSHTNSRGQEGSDIPWYFVCGNCNCKFFHAVPRYQCPRCGTLLVSTERTLPPWRIGRVEKQVPGTQRRELHHES